MKKVILIILLSFFANNLNAQEEITTTNLTESQTEEIKTLFIDYLNEIQTEPKDWNKIIDFTYPKLFTLMPETDMIDLLKKSFKNEIFYTSFDKMELKKIKQSFSYKDIFYTKVLYKSVMTFHFEKSEKQKESEFNDYITFMLSAYKNQFKDSEVTKINNDISISGIKTIIAIHTDKLDKSCYMLELLKDNEMYYSMFLDEEVAKYISTNF
jgi:hypothetical protein